MVSTENSEKSPETLDLRTALTVLTGVAWREEGGQLVCGPEVRQIPDAAVTVLYEADTHIVRQSKKSEERYLQYCEAPLLIAAAEAKLAREGGMDAVMAAWRDYYEAQARTTVTGDKAHEGRQQEPSLHQKSLFDM